jgi:hypothetical protein
MCQELILVQGLTVIGEITTFYTLYWALLFSFTFHDDLNRMFKNHFLIFPKLEFFVILILQKQETDCL